ncbi:MAG: hypothetical protein K8U57_03420 [Planctomycetes bacterium]|nr:hypothetical protein [Planctomycetota bacterium]
MTEAEWLKAKSPTPMLGYLEGKASERKLRLFAVACCRRHWHFPLEEMAPPDSTWIADIRAAVDVGEKLADGEAHASEVEQARDQSGCGIEVLYAFIGCVKEGESLRAVSTNLLDAAGELSSNRQSEAKAQCGLLRCVFGDSFKRIRRQRKWLTPTVTQLAEHIYQERAFDQMPILADALQDAECDNADILNHCRQPSEHVRGCWVVDLILGKS